MLTLRLFGGFQLVYDGEMVENPGGDAGRALLAYLAVESDRPHSRQELATLIWPETTDKESRNRLRVTLSRLRSALEAIEQLQGAEVLQVDREQVQINPDAKFQVDVRVFADLLFESERHAHRSVAACYVCRGRLEEAISLYQGGFLQGVSLSDSAPFDEWSSLNKERYQRLVIEALEVLVDYHLQRGDFSLAMGYARQQLNFEPWRENAHRQLMNALALSGDRATALAQFQICQQMMLEQFNAEVSPETITLYERINRSELADGRMKRTHNLPAPATPLVGRQEEMSQIQGWEG